jgi:hypothetical protein
MKLNSGKGAKAQGHRERKEKKQLLLYLCFAELHSE